MIWISLKKKEMKKVRSVKHLVWLLINYIPDTIRESVGNFKDKIVSLFKANTPKQTAYGRGQK